MISLHLLDKINAQLDPIESISIPFPVNGEFHHFKKGNKEPSSSHIWCVGETWEYKGNSYQTVTCGDWRTGENFTVKSYDPKTETKQSLSYAKKHIEKIEQTKQEEKDKKHKDCKDKWEHIYGQQPVKSDKHPYISIKKLSSNQRARIRDNTLLIPVEHPDYGFVGAQQIFKKDDKFLKMFTKGIRMKGSFNRVTNFDIKNTPLVYLTEGYATGCSIYEATKTPVIVAFACNNIIPVIVSLRKLNKSIRIIIAGDDDHGNSKNPGRFKADQATKQFTNCISRFPTFKNPDGLSDFNDLHVTESIEQVTAQLEISPDEFIEVNPLGHHGGKYYYVNTQTSEIFNLPASTHTPDNLMAQAPRKYWGQKYGFKKDKENNPLKTPDWDQVKESLFQLQRNIGFFEAEKIRGIGGWIDRGAIVFNSGKHLFIDGEKLPISEHSLQTDYIYEARKNIDINLDEQLTKEEISSIEKCFSLVRYKNPGDMVYMIGTIILAQAPGFWAWRSHQWITGSRGTGKSTILSWLDSLIFTNGTGIIENATAAGIRGELGASAVTCILDEAEAGTPEARKRMNQVMEQARQSSSNTGSKALRGTSTGESVSYQLNSLFIMGSIQTSLNNAADISRFNVIDLEKTTPENFTEMQEYAATFPHLKKKLLAFTVKHASLIQEYQVTVKRELLAYNSSIDARQADQLSWPIAGYWALTQNEAPDEYNLDLLFVTLQINNSDYIESNQSNDENECLGAILDIQTSERNSVYYALRNRLENELGSLGIRVIKYVDDSTLEVFFSSKNANLRHALRETEYHDYAKILRRLPICVTTNAPCRVNGLVKKGLVIKVTLSSASQQNEAVQNEVSVPF